MIGANKIIKSGKSILMLVFFKKENFLCQSCGEIITEDNCGIAIVGTGIYYCQFCLNKKKIVF
jgi:formamidopyrimidine-DNA glycosylase